MKKMREMKEQRKKMNNKGFSLVELIVVIAIMAVLTVVVAPQFMRYIEKSRKSVDLQTVETIKSAVQATLAEETAYDSIGTEDVTIEFYGKGTFPTDRAISNTVKVDSTATEPEFNTELNLNLNKAITFKSKDYKAYGITVTIKADNKAIEVSLGTTKTPYN